VSSAPRFDPLAALTALVRHRLRFVVIGGIAGRLWGSPSVTNDLDICYADDDTNLNALVAALHDVHARLRGAPPDVQFRLDARTLQAGGNFTFVTDAGNLDCLAAPEGTDGYADLVGAAQVMDLDGFSVAVVALDDLMRMKRSAGRPKDRIELEVLGALRDEIEQQGR
jgi:hypothetical protein